MAPPMATKPKPAAITVNPGLGVPSGAPNQDCEAPSQRIPITKRIIWRALIGKAGRALGSATLTGRRPRRHPRSAAE